MAGQDHQSDLFFSCVKIQPFGWLDRALHWCRKETQAEWKWSLIESSSDTTHGIYKFYFKDFQDLVAFNLCF